jgi:cardiolipin synthase
MPNWEAFLHDATRRHAGEPRASAGNRLLHLIDDDRITQAVWDAIEDAQQRVWVSMYLLKPDRVGRGTIARLAQAAKRGVEVRLICDGFTSWDLTEQDLGPLRRAGGEVVYFHPVWPFQKEATPLGLRHFPTRNHRKLFLIDGETALCGGFNLSEFYAGRAHGHFFFDDTVLRADGPVAHDLARVFARTWQEITGSAPPLPPRPAPHPEGARAAALETDSRRDTPLAPFLVEAITRAEERCVFVTPFFVPPRPFYDALLGAARRGVDVRILTAGDTDRVVARWAGWHSYDALLGAGARIYEMKGRVLHSKTVTIDGAFGSVGSYNMDAWTTRHCLDLSVVFCDAGVAGSLEHEFRLGLKDADEVTLADVRARNPAVKALHGLTYHTYLRL